MNKNLVLLNIKMTSTRKKKEKIEVIQIGAVKLTKDFELVSTFSKFIKIEGSRLNDVTIAKTMATQSKMDEAEDFLTTYKAFSEWAGDIEENAFVFWGKFEYKMLQKELVSKGYDGEYLIKKYFNYQAYLETKLGCQLSLNDAMNKFELEVEGTLKDACDYAKNMSRVYEEAIKTTDVNKLWFEGKLIRIKDELIQTKEHIGKHGFTGINLYYIDEVIDKCNLQILYSDSFTKEERENKLKHMRIYLDDVESRIEDVVLEKFKRDAMIVQWCVIKKRLYETIDNIEEFKKIWAELSKTYQFFNKNRRGTYSLQYQTFKEFYRSLDRKKSTLIELQRKIKIENL